MGLTRPRPRSTIALQSGRLTSGSFRGADLRILVTGVAGFIGFHCARAFAARGDQVVGIDNLNAYYDVALKEARLAALAKVAPGVVFRKADIADREALRAAVGGERFDIVVHLAAQAGVRASISHPHAYAEANLTGHLNMLEAFRHSDSLLHFVYASSSSVYGANRKLPFAEADRVDDPISLYAATKRADELMSEVYARLYGMPVTGLRFFTVYGPFGRPDMALWLFTDAVSRGEPVTLFNHGNMRRDFTYIDDVVRVVCAIASGPPINRSRSPHIYNIGNSRSENLRDLLAIIERSLGRKAKVVEAPMPPGDVPETHADLTWIKADYGYAPEISIDVGVPRFVEWYRDYLRSV
ncbi:MAG TPA: NAD-dependent epimerase/dehydratase family protein [Bauldia sp.]|nr:NAD-dependent epimerase/dehydratase family protein [Bauldia sp.]